jgi:hypothetical protein
MPHIPCLIPKCPTPYSSTEWQESSALLKVLAMFLWTKISPGVLLSRTTDSGTRLSEPTTNSVDKSQHSELYRTGASLKIPDDLQPNHRSCGCCPFASFSRRPRWSASKSVAQAAFLAICLSSLLAGRWVMGAVGMGILENCYCQG